MSKLKACDFIFYLTSNNLATIYGGCRSDSLAHAERRNALTSLDYAPSSGLDSASRAKVEVEATIKQTSEGVSSLPWASATCDVGHNKHCWCFCPPPCSRYTPVQTHKWYKSKHSICQSNNCVFQILYSNNSIQAPCLHSFNLSGLTCLICCTCS